MNNFPVCASSELDLFRRPPIQTSIQESKWVEYTPTVDFEKGKSPINISIPGTEGEYIDLSNIYFYMRTSIVKDATNEIIKEADEIGPINYGLNTIFKTCEVSLNNKKVSSTSDHAYRSIIETLLNWNKDSKLTHLESSGFSKDVGGRMDSLDFKSSTTTTVVNSLNIIKEEPKQNNSNVFKPVETDKSESEGDISMTETVVVKSSSSREKRDNPPISNPNHGLLKRRSFYIGRSCEYYGKIHADIFNIEKLLLDRVNLDIKLIKNDDKFCLIGKEGYSLQINEFLVHVRKCKISNDILVAHALALERNNSFYPLTRVDVTIKTITPNVQDATFEDVIKGPLPKRIVIGMVESAAYNGALNRNPFNFQNFNLKYVSLLINGANGPHPPIEFEYSSNNPKCVRGYYSLFSSNEVALRGGNDISLNDYANGYQLIVFDLSQDGCVNTDHFNPEMNGSLRIKLAFSKPTSTAISFINYYEYENYFEIGKTRKIDYNFIN